MQPHDVFRHLPGRLCTLLLLAVLAGCQCGDPTLIQLNDEEEEGSRTPSGQNTEDDPGDDKGGSGTGEVVTGGCVDNDGDGYGTGAACMGPDCDDGDAALGSDGARSCYTGPAGTAGTGVCSAGVQTCSAGVLSACRNEVHPAEEVCDGLDNDCDGNVDEQVTRSCYSGPEGSEGVGVCAGGTQTCSAGAWGACAGEVLPSAEICDGIDNDCDGEIDENVVRSCYGGPAGTEGVGVCSAGVQACNAGAWGACTGETLPSAETCDGADNDCDGNIDEQVTRVCYSGPSGTAGVGVCSAGVQTCSLGAWGSCAGEVTPSAEVCDGADNDCNGSVDEQLVRSCYGGPSGTAGVGVCSAGSQTCSAGSWGQCSGDVQPGAEVCDNQDNDCDGQIDEQVTRSCYGGPAGTEGVGVCSGGTQTCSAGAWGSCAGETTPGAEVCDNQDNDCDGQTDEQVTRSCYSGPSGTEGVGVCSAGSQTCSAGAWGSCAGETTPGAEVCDGADNDCDGTVDEALVRSCYGGPAGTSGVGVCASGQQTCSAGDWGQCSGDVQPGAEVCDGLDNDCDGQVDENVVRSCYTGPAGTDGVGACGSGTQTCSAGAWGSCAGETTPGAEVCDGRDNDCDGTVDEALVRSCYGGPAGTEGVGLCSAGTETCSAGAWGSCTGAVTPSADVCDNLDNDCDGQIDEALVRSCYDGPSGTAGVGVCSAGTQTCSAGDWGTCSGQVTPSTDVCDNLDNDCDGQVDEALVRSCYSGPSGTAGVGVCTAGSQTCAAGDWGTCSGEVTPSTDVCDNLDNDCDGQIDEALVRSCYSGPSGTQGVGACVGGSQTCSAGSWGVCAGEVTPKAETCDNVDNDCDGSIDDAVTRACYSGPPNTQGVGICQGGTQTCSAGAWGGCAGEVTPSTETCDAKDNDCDGTIDEALSRSCYSGPAGTQGVGVCQAGTQSCQMGNWGTCAGQVLPTTEVCDAKDNDCDGSLDENLVQACYPGPSGTEGVGLCSAGASVCTAGTWGSCGGYTLPQPEVCDLADNNCNGNVDENETRITFDGSSQETIPAYAPVDIIFVIDNSGSMTDEIVAVQNNINQNFATLIGQSGLDYRVIMISKHGSATADQSICVSAPLSGNSQCTTPTTCPVNGPRFFHYSYEIGSRDSLDRIISTYGAPDACGLAPNGWKAWLRPGVRKYFIEITDDEPKISGNGAWNLTATQFDSQLLALSSTHWGTSTKRNYTFHSIVGLHENNPRTKPWAPTDPLVTTLCTGNGGNVRAAGTEYQKLSQWTQGLRYPICEYQSFDAIFQQVAEGIIIGSQLSCAFSVNSIPPGTSMDGAYLEFTPTNGGGKRVLTQVADESACTTNAFYTIGNQVHLCPAACTMWRNDPTAIIDVVFVCSGTP